MDRQSHFMALALELGRLGEGRTRPNPAVGALVVKNGVIVGEGFHQRAGEPHAEVLALRQAGNQAHGAELYVTLEPCNHQGRTGPCCDAIISAGIAKVVIGTPDPNPKVAGGGAERLRAAGIEVLSGVEEKACRRLIAPFTKHSQTGLPYVILKAAMTLDGQLATSTGDSRWVSGEDSRRMVHRLRDRFDAVLVGIGTVLADDPQLTVRLEEGGRDPIRIVLDRELKIPVEARLLRQKSSAPTWIVTGSGPLGPKVARLKEQGVEILSVPEDAIGLNLPLVMKLLGARGVQSVLVEGGGRLNGSLLRARLIDRLLLFVAPKILGGNDGMPLFGGRGVIRMEDALKLKDVEISRSGDDFLVEGEFPDVYRAD